MMTYVVSFNRLTRLTINECERESAIVDAGFLLCDVPSPILMLSSESPLVECTTVDPPLKSV